MPFNKPVWLGTEIERITEAITTHGHVAGGGPFGERCEALLRARLGQTALLVTSCTHALEMAALLLGIGPGDEFIVPSFAFVSTANAFALRGARPVFADVDRNGNILPDEVARLRTGRTRAVVPVHYAGHSADMDALLSACDGVPLVEDAAQALGAAFGGRPLGTFGAAGAFSFHETKNVGCGEGGALTLRDEALLERAHVLRDKGTNRRKFLQGLADKYTWVDTGSSWVLSDLNAAYLDAQLEALDAIQARRKTLHDRYTAELRPIAERKGGYVIEGHPRNTPNHHIFAIVLRETSQRSRFIAHMRGGGIMTPFHYVPLHDSPVGRALGADRPLPGSERLGSCLVRLPLFYNLSDEDQAQVIDRTTEFLHGL
ncbi:MAG: dTDP-4-amino-4,6-dideoxygalactose transaminase [Anaeromyxobacteraceae bacterium]